MQHANPGRAFSLALGLVADADATEPVGVDLGRAGGGTIGPDHGGQQRAADDGLGVQALARVVAQRGAPGHAGADRLEGVGVAGPGSLGAHFGIDPLGQQVMVIGLIRVVSVSAIDDACDPSAQLPGQVVDAGLDDRGEQDAVLAFVRFGGAHAAMCLAVPHNLRNRQL